MVGFTQVFSLFVLAVCLLSLFFVSCLLTCGSPLLIDVYDFYYYLLVLGNKNNLV